MDVSSRFVVSLLVGKRDTETLAEVVADFADRTGGAPPALMTTDDCSTYADVLVEQYGETVVPPRTGKPGRPRQPFKQWPPGAVYATVNKTYRKGRVTAVDRKVVFGTEEELAQALASSSAGGKINTAFIERQNGTDRTYSARKARKTYEFSKVLLVHLAVTWWVMFCYNFHHLHRGLRLRQPDGTWLPRTPAMVIGRAEHPLTMAEILITQAQPLSASSLHVPTSGVELRVMRHRKDTTLPPRRKAIRTRQKLGWAESRGVQMNSVTTHRRRRRGSVVAFLGRHVGVHVRQHRDARGQHGDAVGVGAGLARRGDDLLGDGPNGTFARGSLRCPLDGD